MTTRRLILPATLLALAITPAFAQDPPAPPEHQDAAPAPRAVERAARSRAREGDDGAVRAPRTSERVAVPDARVRERAEAPAPAPAAPPAFEEQGGRRRRSGGSSGRSSGGSGRASGGGGGRDSGGAARRGGGVRNPDADGRGGNVAQAVPRSQAPRPPQANWGNSYGRRYYSGAGGLGYYYYDPWSWYGGGGWPAYGALGGWGGYYGNNWGGYYGINWGGYYSGGYGGGYGYGNYGGPYGWSVGGVRLKVNERDAEVYVDGYYAGVVDDFDGIWQQLRLDDGGYRMEIRKPGFDPLVFDVRIQPGRTITYRGQMQTMP